MSDDRLAKMLATAVGDLPGEWSIQTSEEHSFFTPGLTAVLIRQDLPAVGKAYANWQAVTPEFADDDLVLAWLAMQFHAAFRPWERPDRPLLAPLTLFPRLQALGSRWRSLRLSWSHWWLRHYMRYRYRHPKGITMSIRPLP